MLRLSSFWELMMDILGCMSSKTVGVFMMIGFVADCCKGLMFLRRWRNLNQLIWGTSLYDAWFVV